MDETNSASQVDPRAPRFGQALTAALALGGVVFGRPATIFLLAAVLGIAVLSGWRIDAWASLWGLFARPVVGPPAETEAATPHRFAKLIGATFAAAASLLLLAGGAFPAAATAGYAVAFVVGALALVGTTTGFCLGCRLYGQVSYFRRLGVL